MAPLRSKEWSRKSLFKYRVFLSFYGKDTRTTFTDHLYRALVDRAIRTFGDNIGIEKGKEIDSEIREAIHDSEGSILVLSEGYASSRWCLDEVVMILERKRNAKHKVVPVFYHVNPDHVSNQSEAFGQAFDEHAKNFGGYVVNGWRAALTEVAGLGGFVIKDGYEAEFIQDIVNVLERKLNPSPQYVPSFLVGVDSLVEKLESWLQSISNGVNVCIIHGTDGVGKTTLAKHVFNRNFSNFECVSFASDVGETLKQPDGLLHLKRGLVSDVLKRKVDPIESVEEGLVKIQEVVSHKKIIIFLDDINEANHLKSMLVIKDWLHKRSKIIITTHEEGLVPGETYTRFKVEQLNESDSLKLFNWHASGTTMEHIGRLVKFCGGFPLALEFLASMLAGEDTVLWENVFQKLEAIPASIIEQILKMSYYSIDNEDYQKISSTQLASSLEKN